MLNVGLVSVVLLIIMVFQAMMIRSAQFNFLLVVFEGALLPVFFYSTFSAWVAMPQAILREHPYDCRSKNDAVLWNRSPRLFNNPTKQDRYGAQRFYALPGGVLEMPHGDAVPVPLTHQAIVGSSDVYIRRPGGDGYVGPIRPARDTNPDAPKVIRIQSMRTPGNWAPVPPTIQTTTPVATPPLRTSARTLGGF
jgi:hypothetical protein